MSNAELSGNKDSSNSASTVILVVEDDQANRELVVDILSFEKYKILQADNGETALGILEKNPGISLLITDAVMPGLSGTALVAHAQLHYKSLKILMLTGKTVQQISEECNLAPSCILQKPVSPDLLLDKVKQLLRSQ